VRPRSLSRALAARRPFRSSAQPAGTDAGRKEAGGNGQRDDWFWAHYDEEALGIINFLADGEWDLDGKRVADIGCGEGYTPLALVLRSSPALMVGFDLRPVDLGNLQAKAREQGVLKGKLPQNLEFRASGPARLPAEDKSFDIVVSWSAFEHVADPIHLLREIKRVLADSGVLMVQIWPFWHSEHGSHLWEWFPEGWVQHTKTLQEIEQATRASGRHTPEWTEVMLNEYRLLNRLTLDELGECVRHAGFHITRLELQTHTVNPPEGVSHVPLSLLGIAGVKLLAVP
jgi:SAM-dependent methyltransferase